jgi:hypothetical protein
MDTQGMAARTPREPTVGATAARTGADTAVRTAAPIEIAVMEAMDRTEARMGPGMAIWTAPMDLHFEAAMGVMECMAPER